jgi:signal transduction histidine kinase
MTVPMRALDPDPAERRPRAFHLGSLQRRLLAAALAFVTVALVAAGVSIGFILHRFVRGQLDGRLDERIASLASDLRRTPDGAAALDRDEDRPRFERPRSGWYWQVRRGNTVLRSGSLAGRDLQIPEHRPPPPERDEPAPADGTGPWGEALILRIKSLGGEGAEPPIVIAASAPAAALRGPVLEAFGTLAACLGVIGLLLVAGTFLQVRLGLRPLERLRAELAEVRTGRRARMPLGQPAEVRPLVEEMNALLDQNEANLAHARGHVANLAHGLKTSLATLTMALGEVDRDGSLGHLVAEMDRRVRHHLRRARVAALGGSARKRVALDDHVDGMRLTFSRLFAEKGVALEAAVPAGLAVACDAQDVDEMLGNLIDNACQWCRGRVRVSAAASSDGVVIDVEDDGPGLDAAAIAEVARRGHRLDESLPGNGFGLSITTELAELYGGGLRLDRSGLGGLRATLRLPA